MKVKARQSGLTLMEMTVVIAVMALLAVFGLPAIRALINSFESEAGAKAMISAGLASGRAIAASQQHYAGIRFQKAYDSNNPDLLNAPQYMVFIMHDQPSTGLSNGFRAVKGIKPIKLPDSIGVMEVVNDDGEINENDKLTDKTTFSIVFSPSGKLVIHYVRVMSNFSRDDIFNTQTNVKNGIAMFFQDYDSDGFQEEPSRRSFIIYDKSEFNRVNENRRWSDYLRHLEVIYINPYTGTMIKK